MVNMIINPRIAEASRYRGFPYDADLQASNGVPAAGHAFAGAIGGTDGLIIAKPEYNCSISGTLRNAINWLSRLQNQPFAGKPIALESSSPGPLGGGRVHYDIRRAMVFLDAIVLIRPEIFVGDCTQRINERSGEMTDVPTRELNSRQLVAFGNLLSVHGRKRGLTPDRSLS